MIAPRKTDRLFWSDIGTLARLVPNHTVYAAMRRVTKAIRKSPFRLIEWDEPRQQYDPNTCQFITRVQAIARAKPTLQEIFND